MATHSSVLAWRIPWTEEPGGLLSMGSHRVGHDWNDLAVAAYGCKKNWYPFSNIHLPLQILKHTGAYYWAFPNIYLWFSAVIYTKKLGMWGRKTYIFFWKTSLFRCFTYLFKFYFYINFTNGKIEALRRKKKNIYIYIHIYEENDLNYTHARWS